MTPTDHITEPRMSIVLATDSYDTIRPVLECLLKQTVKQFLEVVLVTSAPEGMSPALALRDRFAGLRVVEDPVYDLAPARAVGVRAASAPIVFIGETHSFPHPRLAEIILAAFDSSDWAVVVPAVCNANPKGALSWSGYLLDYGRWADGLPAGEIPEPPVYNAAFKRSFLLELGDRLSSALGQSDELFLTMRARGLRTLFEPSAGIGHANAIQPWHWSKNRLLAGLLVASNRSRQWPLARRLVYAGGSFLVPIVLLRRLLPGLRETMRGKPLPAGTMPAVVLGLILRAAGETFGYAGVFCGYAQRGMHQFEMHKLKYAGPRPA